MAHGNYACCAICDSKLYYDPWGDENTKAEICSECVAGLAKEGVIVSDVQELCDWIEREDPAQLREILRKVNFKLCYYRNRVDQLVLEKLGNN